MNFQLRKRNVAFILWILWIGIICIGKVIQIYAVHIDFPGVLTVKNTVVAFYYTIYLCLEKWSTFPVILCFIISAIAGTLSKNALCKSWKSLLGISVSIWAALLLSAEIYVYTYQSIPVGEYTFWMQLEYWIGNCFIFFFCSNFLKNHKELWLKAEKETEQNSTMGKKCGIILLIIYAVSLIPILMVGRYAFPQADDYSFGYHCHQAWVDSHSIMAVIKAAYSMVLEAYFDWQGSFSSIFVMSLQPAVFHKSYYFIVPYIMVGFLTISGWFFFRTIMVKLLKMDKNITGCIALAYVLLVVQYLPSKACGIYWFNGAVHYIIAHSIALMLVACLLYLIYIPYHKWYLILGIVTAFYTGGTNYVTIVSMLFLLGSIVLWRVLVERQNLNGSAWLVVFIYIGSFILNVIAPGNYLRMEGVEGAGLLMSFPLAFKEALFYLPKHYMHWSIWIYICFLIPLFWNGLRKVQMSFYNPMIMILYSWCFMASMFYTPIFTIGNVNVSRFQNIIYITWVLWITIDLAYLIGWLQRLDLFENMYLMSKANNRYFYCLSIAFVVLICLSCKAEPEKNTSFFAWNTLQNIETIKCYQTYQEDVEILERSRGSKARIKQLKNPPQLFVSPDIETWSSGLRSFYGLTELEILKEGE